jgi:hypothetical protein
VGRVGSRSETGWGARDADRERGGDGANDEVAWTTTPHPSPQGGGEAAGVSPRSFRSLAAYPPPCGEGRPRQRTGWGSARADRQRVEAAIHAR